MSNATAAGQPGRFTLGPGDEIVITEMEHHSNIVPWQLLCQRTGATLRWFGVTQEGRLDTSNIDGLITERTRLVAFAHQSNVLGTINPVRAIADRAHAAGALVLVDAAQSVPHMPVDVAALGADFLGFTGHKMLGPTGIGVLWGREELLDAMPPFLGGGEMIRDVRVDGFEATDLPWKFEAGTPPIAEAIGLGAAVDYLSGVGMQAIRQHEIALTQYALDALKARYDDDITIYGPTDAEFRGGVISFSFKGIHPHDLSQVLDQSGVCVRAGHHCAKPLMRCLQVGATARASLYLYNDEADVDALVDALANAESLFL
jgi:cysteine desulfurase/selenocysteine lyase